MPVGQNCYTVAWGWGSRGFIHTVRLLWQQHAKEEDLGLLLIDARNAFIEKNRTAVLWAVRFEWPSGARFAFNFYRHWATVVIRAGDGTGHLLFSKEGVTQGDPVDMVVYGMGIFPLIRELWQAHPGVTQPWYVDYDEARGIFGRIWRHLDDMIVRGPLQGYLPEPTKSILVMSPWNVLQEEAFFRGYVLQIVTGICYIGGFVGTKDSQDR